MNLKTIAIALLLSSLYANHLAAQQYASASPSGAAAIDSGPYATLQYEIGTRILHMTLLDRKKGEPFSGSFIGSINRLSANQDYVPLHPYFQTYMPINDDVQLGFGLAYDEWSIATADGTGGDGDVESEAWTIYIGFRLIDVNGFSPFLETGYSMYDNRFAPFASWYDNGRRNFDLDNSRGLHVAVGCDYKISEHWLANAYMRYVRVDIDGTYIFRGDSRAPEHFVFPLDHVAYGAGVSYQF